MEIQWICKRFEELTVDELYAVLHLRIEVFIVEQNAPYQDADNKDRQSRHLMGWDGDKLTAFCRILPAGLGFAEASIGRVVSSPKYRGKGIGKTLMEIAIQKARSEFQAKNIRIGAQLYLRKFYESFGFVKASETYIEDGIPHIEMLLSE